MTLDVQQTALTWARYDRLAPFYDLVEALIDRFSFRRWWERLFSNSWPGFGNPGRAAE